MKQRKDEIAAMQRRLTAEMRAETRAALKSEQSMIAQIDEQLWQTDQRLGQRIDELAHAQEKMAVLVQVNDRSGAKARFSPPESPSASQEIHAAKVDFDIDAR